ncbi:MAG: hypothetical protein ACXIT4_08365 [Erythrobacter sp.]
MNEVTTTQIVSIVAMLGWLILVGSALASFRLNASQVVRLVLIWAAIFLGAFILVSFLI